MTPRSRTLLLAALLVGAAALAFTPPAAAVGDPQIDCTIVTANACETLERFLQQLCNDTCITLCEDVLECLCGANGCVQCFVDTPIGIPPSMTCDVCVPTSAGVCGTVCVSGCLPIGFCLGPDYGVRVGTLYACVNGTPPNTVGTTCPPAFGSGRGVYLDYGAPGASPEDEYHCVRVIPAAGAPCAAPGQQVEIRSTVTGDLTRCVSTAVPSTCTALTPGPGWTVGVGGTCVGAPWVTLSPPGACFGLGVGIRVWWGSTPGTWPPATDVCLV